jgi:diguanylate cyclase (GGDEF)-like protein
MVVAQAATSGQLRSSVRSWKVWTLPPLLRSYVAGACGAWAVATLTGLTVTRFRWSDMLTFLIIVGCGAIGVEATHRQGEPAGVAAKDLLSAWYLPIALVLPPVYVLLAPVPLLVLTQFRVRPGPVYRRAFSVAVIGLAYALLSLGFHQLPSAWHLDTMAPGLVALVWAGLALVGAVICRVVNAGLVAIAIKSVNPEVSWLELLWNRDEALSDVGEFCIGVMIGMLCMLSPFLALVCLVPVILLQRALLHDQLSAAARLDAKTGLLNGPTWEREATSEIARAVRTGTALSVMLLDLDHFKEVNDRYGHLAGDEVLTAVAGAMKAQTREYDLVARFGGDEFAILLPQSDLPEATVTAERIRRRVADIAVSAGGAIVRTSVSIGVAELCSAEQGVTDLLAAADLSLYRAKENRDHVHSALHDDLSFPTDL